jgi:bacteriophage N4 adsorption protein A
MRYALTLLALSLVCAEQPAHAQSIEIGGQSGKLESFLLYPHLQKGFTALELGDRSTALAEFERAHAIAPNNPTVATYLAQAHRRFGDRAKAIATLTEQLKRNQGNGELLKALNDLQTQAQPVAVASQPVAPVSRVPIPTAGTSDLKNPVAVPPIANSLNTSVIGASQDPSKLAITSPKSAQNTSPTRVKTPSRVAPQAKAMAGTVSAIKEKSARSALAPHLIPQQTAGLPAGYHAADKAYKSSADGDYATALAFAREAVREAPDNRAYLYLLTYLAAQNGSYEEANQIASKALTIYSAQMNLELQQLQQLQQMVRRQLAQQSFDAANQALANGQMQAALQEARKGVEYAPDMLAQRVQWLHALLLANQYHEANQAASDALGDLGDQPALYVLRAYARLKLGQKSLAWTDFDHAVQHPGLTVSESHNFRVIAAQAAVAEAEPQRALQLLAPLDGTTNQSVNIRRQMVTASMQRSAFVNLHAVSGAVLVAPGVLCSGSLHTAACDVWAAEAPVDVAAPFAESAYAAFNERDYRTATSKARQAVTSSPDNAAYKMLLLNALIADKRFEQAEQTATQYLSENGLAGVARSEIQAARSMVRHRLGKPEPAREDALVALSDPNLSLHSEISLLLQLNQRQKARESYMAAVQSGLLKNETAVSVAYLAIQVGDDAYAMSAFELAQAQNKLPDTARLDVAFTANRLERYDEALTQFRKAIEATETGQLALVAQPLFDVKREIANRTRDWGASTYLSYRGISQANPGSTQASASNDNLQGSAEVFWRPFGYQGGRTLEVYGGLSATLSSKANYPTGTESTLGSIGARVKPLGDINVIAALERRLAIGNKTTTDWLVRTAYSASQGTDIRLDAPSWMTTSVYAEAGRYINQRQTYAVGEGIVGRSFALNGGSARTVLMPHMVLAADYDSTVALGSKGAVGAGVGVNLRHWFNEDRYTAPRSHLDISLQYRGRIGGDARAKGVFLRATLSY